MNRNFWLRIFPSFLLVTLFTLLAISTSQAQPPKGKFTLPYEADWNGVLLPPGDYSFSFHSYPKVLSLKPAKRTGMFFLVCSTDEVRGGTSSKLVLVKNGEVRTVSALYLTRYETIFYFNTPVKYQVSANVISQNTKPEGVFEIPVVFAGK